MKKIVLSIAGVMAAAAFAPEASALPAFARQTGMACTACHAQHFPVLNGFGRAFKAAGYTMMGAQEKVEGEHLSIPSTLNAAILAKVRYQKDNGARAVPAVGVSNTPSDGMLQFGDEFSLFFAGRVAENIGFLFEGNTVAAPLLAGFKLPVMFDMGAAKIGVTAFTTDALGAMYGYELSSGGVMRANRWAEHRAETSAVQYIGVATAATGFTASAQNDMGYITATMFSPDFGMGANGGAVPSFDMNNNYFRIAATPTIGDWSVVGGIGHFSGTSSIGSGSMATRATFFDVQAQGEVGGKELSVYAQHASAPAVVGGTNLFNAGINDRKATTIGVDYSVIPHILSIGAAYRNAKTGGTQAVAGVAAVPASLVAGVFTPAAPAVVAAPAAAGLSDNAITLTAVYDLVQNVALHANYSSYSGAANTGVGRRTSLTTFMLEASW